MDTLVALIQASTSVAELHEELKKAEVGVIQNPSSRGSLAPALAQLDPAAHSLGYAFLLSEALKHKPVPRELVELASDFLRRCDAPQARLAPAQVGAVSKHFCSACIEQGNALLAVEPLGAALEKMRGAPGEATAVHMHFYKACLKAKCYRAALGALEQPVLDVATTDGLKPYDLVVMLYYGGRLRLGMRQYDEALAQFTLCFAASQQGLTAALVEAYRSLVLTSLIANGELAPLPKYSGGNIQRTVRQHAIPYNEIATAYAAHDAEALAKALSANKDVLVRHNNFGLVKQVQQSLARRNIKRLAQTFLTLSLDDVATKTHLEGGRQRAEQLMLQMIEDREIFARIDQRTMMVKFEDDPEQYDDARTVESLHSKMQATFEVNRKVQTLADDISTSEQYISRSTSLGRPGRWTDADEGAMGEEEEMGA